ncbi:MAG TPA: HPF/RaiA family ribosome-associated protein [Terracidiphilus sp.]|jgi:putative sigma-54 modulation protein
MEVELTARQVRIPKALRQQAEEGMDRIARILGKTTSASITFRVQRHLHIAELTVNARMHTIAARGQADSQESALRAALAHAEQQAVRYRDRNLTRKRLPKEEKIAAAPPVTRSKKTRALVVEEEVTPDAKTARPRAAIPAHSFPASPAVMEPHIVKSAEAVAMRPMTIEEAVKEAEFRDRDLLVFRNQAGDLFVLHRRRDGQMELVEIP